MAAQQKVVIVGGGPVGALSALYAARRGHQVELYDLRDDPNHGDPNARAAIAVIPLALSERGIRAVAGAHFPGLLETILSNSRPIYTRMVHDQDALGNPRDIPMAYGPLGECLHTLPREKITKHVLLALEKEPNATIHFNHKLLSCDFKSQVAQFEPLQWKEKARDAEARLAQNVGTKQSASSIIKTVNYDFIIGADGTYSSLRQCMMREIEMDFEQSYINALWCDLIIPAKADGDYRMNSQCLHVWPGVESIVMAQPDFDGSFRAGMVAPTDQCRDMEEHPEKFVEWFSKAHAGIVPDLLSAESVTAQWTANQKIPLKSVKCGRFGYKDSAVLLGDAAHTMTPFHAMGMITGLEDVRIFFEEFLDKARATCSEAENAKVFCPAGTVQGYTDFRKPDVQAMTDMANEHYYELRVGIRSWANRAKKDIESTLAKWVPSLDWATMYSRIQFSHERFSEIVKKEEQQKKTIRFYVPTMLLGSVAASLAMVFH